MAGHPTIGSTFALAHTGFLEPGRPRVVFGLNVGPTPVDLEWDGDRLRFAWMTQGLPEFGRRDRRPVAGGRDAGLDARRSGARAADPGRVVRVAAALRAAARSRDGGSRHQRLGRVPAPDGGARTRTCRSSCSPCCRRAARPPCTAGCSRRTSASSRIRRPEAPPDRSAAIWWSTGWSRRRPRASMLSLQGVAMGRREPAAHLRRRRVRGPSPACGSAAKRCSSAAGSCSCDLVLPRRQAVRPAGAVRRRLVPAESRREGRARRPQRRRQDHALPDDRRRGGARRRRGLGAEAG